MPQEGQPAKGWRKNSHWHAADTTNKCKSQVSRAECVEGYDIFVQGRGYSVTVTLTLGGSGRCEACRCASLWGFSGGTGHANLFWFGVRGVAGS